MSELVSDIQSERIQSIKEFIYEHFTVVDGRVIGISIDMGFRKYFRLRYVLSDRYKILGYKFKDLDDLEDYLRHQIQIILKNSKIVSNNETLFLVDDLF